MDEKTTTINVLIDVAEGRRWFVREDVRSAVQFLFEDYEREQNANERLEDELAGAAAREKHLRHLLEEEREETRALKDVASDYQDAVFQLEGQVANLQEYLAQERRERDELRHSLAAVQREFDDLDVAAEGYKSAFDAANQEVERLRQAQSTSEATLSVMDTNEGLKERIRELEFKYASILHILQED